VISPWRGGSRVDARQRICPQRARCCAAESALCACREKVRYFATPLLQR